MSRSRDASSAARGLGPNERAVLGFIDGLARLPMGRVPELVELASERDEVAVAAARRRAALAAEAAGLADAVRRGDELVLRWATALLRDDRLGVPAYDISSAGLEPADRAAAASVARDTLLALVLGDRLDRVSFELLLAPWHAFLSPVAGLPQGVEVSLEPTARAPDADEGQ